MEYALYLPKNYDPEKKFPLIVALHGLGGNPQQIIRSRGLTEQAEKYGYIVVAPMGYNSSGWYGSRAPGNLGQGRGGRPGVGPGFGGGRPGFGGARPGPGGFAPPALATPGTILPPRIQSDLKLTDEQKEKFEKLQKEVDDQVREILSEEQNRQLESIRAPFDRGPGGPAKGPVDVSELSEKDVMNVLEIVRKEYSVDDKRIYLIGHSMGGAGTWHLGTKYADIWAGLAPIAPAAFGQPEGLDKLKKVPVIVVQGDRDTLVRPEGTRRWVAKLEELKLDHEYLEINGAGHGDVISRGMANIFEFFEKRHQTDNDKE